MKKNHFWMIELLIISQILLIQMKLYNEGTNNFLFDFYRHLWGQGLEHKMISGNSGENSWWVRLWWWGVLCNYKSCKSLFLECITIKYQIYNDKKAVDGSRSFEWKDYAQKKLKQGTIIPIYTFSICFGSSLVNIHYCKYTVSIFIGT